MFFAKKKENDRMIDIIFVLDLLELQIKSQRGYGNLETITLTAV